MFFATLLGHGQIYIFSCLILLVLVDQSNPMQSWKKLHAAHALRADIFSELRTFWFRNYVHMSRLQICVGILIYFEVKIEEGLKFLF